LFRDGIIATPEAYANASKGFVKLSDEDSEKGKNIMFTETNWGIVTKEYLDQINKRRAGKFEQIAKNAIAFAKVNPQVGDSQSGFQEGQMNERAHLADFSSDGILFPCTIFITDHPLQMNNCPAPSFIPDSSAVPFSLL
jgi:hypothetical protein